MYNYLSIKKRINFNFSAWDSVGFPPASVILLC